MTAALLATEVTKKPIVLDFDQIQTPAAAAERTGILNFFRHVLNHTDADQHYPLGTPPRC